MSVNKKTVAAALLILVSCLILGLLVHWYYDGEERGRSYAVAQHAAGNLQIGMPRHETQQYVQEAWRHYECEYSDFSVDIYLFGSHDLSLAGTLYLKFKKEGTQETLSQIADIDYYMLYRFDYCKVFEK